MKFSLTAIFALCVVPFLSVQPLVADGNISVQMIDGDLIVNGQSNTNQSVFIRSGINPGDIVFHSNGDTTINGSDVFLQTDFIGDMIVDLKSGEKTLIFSEYTENYLTFHGDLFIETKGNDPVILLLDSVWVEGEAVISTRHGDDAIIINDSHFRDGLEISTSQGDDAMLLGWQNSIDGRLHVATSSGNDHVILFNSELAGQLDFNTGSGDDWIGLYNSYLWGGVVHGGSGTDTFGQDDNFGRYFLLRLSVENQYHSGAWGMYSHAFFTNTTFWNAVYLHNYLNLHD